MSDVKKMGGILDRLQIITAGGYFLDQLFDYTSGNLDYKGINESHKAATSATNWLIWKYTWSDSNNTRIEGPLEGAWDNRASLDWA